MLVNATVSRKDTIMHQGPSLSQLGINPLYKAMKPSVLQVCKKRNVRIILSTS